MPSIPPGTHVLRRVPRLPRRALVALTGVLLVLAGTTGTAAAAEPTLKQQSLAVSVSVSVSGSTVTATTAVVASAPVTVAELGVCVRSSTGQNFDLPRRIDVALAASAVRVTGARTLPGGDYRLGTCVRTARGWRPLPGWQHVRVAVPVPVPVDPVPTGPTGRWSLRLDQDFTSGQLDRKVWRANRFGADGTDEVPFNPDQEDAQFNSRNVAVDADALDLSTSLASTTARGRSYRYRSGTVSSEGGFAFGDDSFVEARVQIPRSAGLWPAFWAVPSGDWPPEIDVFEFFDTGTDTRPAFNYHYRDSAGAVQQTGPHRYGQPGVDYRVGWHTYGLERSGGRLVPWLDGVAYPDAAVRSQSDQAMFLILNLSVRRGSSAPAGASMQVSHVRAWSRA